MSGEMNAKNVSFAEQGNNDYEQKNCIDYSGGSGSLDCDYLYLSDGKF